MNYKKYSFSKKEWFFHIVEYILLAGAVSNLFFDSLIAFFIFLPFGYFFIKLSGRKLKEKRVNELKTEFIQAISFMGTSLAAGISMENSLKEARDELNRVYESGSLMCEELNRMLTQMELGIRLEELMDDFAERSGVTEIKDFSTVFKIARKGGGKYTDVINNCIEMISSNQEMERDIQILISGKRFEQKIMNIIPFVLIGCLKIASPDLIGILYHNVTGAIIMTICLGIYIGAIALSEKIADIKV